MNNLLTEGNLLKGITIAIKVNIISFFAATIISLGDTYLLAGVWDWGYLMYLCLFYGINLSLTLLVKKWYKDYLHRKKTLACAKP